MKPADDTPRPPAQANAPVSVAELQAIALRHNKIIIGGVSVGLVLCFVVGVALGLNIHPPDQYELETGYKTGYSQGRSAGNREGVEKGYQRGFTDGLTQGKTEGEEIARREIAGEMRSLAAQNNKLVAQIATTAKMHDAQLKEVEADAWQDAVTQTTSSESRKCATEILQLRAQHAEALDEAKKAEYRRGLHEAGYQKWYDDGFAAGEKKGHDFCELECARRVETAREEGRRTGIDDGKKAGFVEGLRQGKQEGRRKGYDEGQQAGYKRGYNVGYKDGYDAAGGPQ